MLGITPSTSFLLPPRGMDEAMEDAGALCRAVDVNYQRREVRGDGMRMTYTRDIHLSGNSLSSHCNRVRG